MFQILFWYDLDKSALIKNQYNVIMTYYLLKITKHCAVSIFIAI